jgi:protein TonB
MSKNFSHTFPHNFSWHFSAEFFSAKNPQFVALLFTALIHAIIAAWAIFPFSPTIIKQQTLHVSFVAPNSQQKQNESKHSEKFIPATEKQNALKQQKKSEEIAAQKNQNLQNQVEKHTSGRVSQNAVATKSADSEPIFDAEYLNNEAPYYPQAAKNRGIQGNILLEVTVKTDGTALNIRIIKSSGSSILDEAALSAVRDWKFVPARRAGEIVQANVIVPVEFKLI